MRKPENSIPLLTIFWTQTVNSDFWCWTEHRLLSVLGNLNILSRRQMSVFFIFFKYAYVCACISFSSPHACRGLRQAKEAVWQAGPGIAGGCELPNVATRSQCIRRVKCTLKCWFISPKILHSSLFQTTFFWRISCINTEFTSVTPHLLSCPTSFSIPNFP